MDLPSKILLVRYSALGDVIQTVPILSMLRKAFPEAKIGWAIDAELVSTIENHPALDYIHACKRREWAKSLTNPTKWASTYENMRSFVGEIESVGYDVAIDAQGLFKTSVLPFLAGIKRRVGYSHGRECSGLFYNERYINLAEYFDPKILHLQHMAVLAKALGANEVQHEVQAPVVSDSIRKSIQDRLDSAFSTPAPVIAMAPATQWESKAWPLEHWVALLDDILTKTPLNVVMVGSKGDIPIVQRVLQAFPQRALIGRVLDISGKTSVPELYALYERIDGAVGSDSAPLHIAGAVKTPYLFGIFGPTGYRRTPPIGSEHIKLFSTEINNCLPCQPCHKKTCPLGTNECMTGVRPKEVFRAIQQALSKSSHSMTW